ncbi:unnamed protein product [Bursaphelenchus xylophilus]|uniref:(pine wood nematode) hypothetical protein n=1 Tax=Bursaphelenchus xylophilus TaxID=6326 RepID=A0A1I7SF34_BURXY|nr:unnamed protein product [Bursaphelenchus xylophilus]CAG9078902.1 unnamed protein product [Bursaphelenchus xylophilus]
MLSTGRPPSPASCLSGSQRSESFIQSPLSSGRNECSLRKRMILAPRRMDSSDSSESSSIVSISSECSSEFASSFVMSDEIPKSETMVFGHKGADHLNRAPYFHGLLPVEDAVLLLEDDGDFLVIADPRTDEKDRIVSAVLKLFYQHNGKIWHEEFVFRPYGVTLDQEEVFPTIVELIRAHRAKKRRLRTGALLISPVGRQPWEVKRSELRIGRFLAGDKLSKLNVGWLSRRTRQTQPVAVVSASCGWGTVLTKTFWETTMKRIRVQKLMSHPNIMAIYGVAFNRAPILVVSEYIDSESLESFFKNSPNTLSVAMKLALCFDIALAMNYVHVSGFLHGSLDLSNVHIFESYPLAKIVDLGVMVGRGNRLEDEAEDRLMAPEVVETGVVSEKSDIWSIGMLFNAIFKEGDPYGKTSKRKIHRRLAEQRNYEPDFPYGIPSEMMKINRECWEYKSKNRPNAANLAFRLSKYMEIERFRKNDELYSFYRKYYEVGDKPTVHLPR